VAVAYPGAQGRDAERVWSAAVEDAPGSRDLLARIDAGLLVPRGDAQAFANRLIEFLGLPAEELVRRSRDFREAARSFTWPGIADLT
jgi:glycosyltransferase involved in cell wall biosynthesis